MGNNDLSLMISIIVPLSTYLNRNFSLKTLLASNLLFLAGIMIDFFSPTFMVLLFGRLLQGAATGIALPLMFHIILTFAPSIDEARWWVSVFDNGHCSSNWPHLWRHYDFTFYMESYLPVSCARFDSFFDYRLVCYSRDGSTKVVIWIG